MIVGTFETWSYIHSQMDYTRGRKVKVHIVDGDRTLCGRKSHGMETEEVEDFGKDVIRSLQCARCREVHWHRRAKEGAKG